MAKGAVQQDMYVVQKILDKRFNKAGKAQYLVKWVGWSINQSTWQPQSNLSTVSQMVKQFNKKLQIEKKLSTSDNTKSTPQNPNLNGKTKTSIKQKISEPVPQKNQKNGQRQKQRIFQKKTKTQQISGSSFNLKNQSITANNAPSNNNSDQICVGQLTQAQVFDSQLRLQNLMKIQKQKLQNKYVEYFKGLMPKKRQVTILQMYNPDQLNDQDCQYRSQKRRIRNYQFVVVKNNEQIIMNRDQLKDKHPQALVEWYEEILHIRARNKRLNQSKK